MLAVRRGDTIIEVLFAFAVFALVAVGAFSIMNRGTATTQRSLEITQVRQEMDAQAATLRFLHDAYITAYQPGETYDVATPAGQWQRMSGAIKASGVTAAQTFGDVDSCARTAPANAFILNTKTATYVGNASMLFRHAPAVSGVQYQSDTSSVLTSTDGIWIEGVPSATSADVNQANIGFIDFHIRACWDSVGQTLPVTLGTIVRLYEPR